MAETRWDFGPISKWEKLPDPCECVDVNSKCDHVKELGWDLINYIGANFRGRFLLPYEKHHHVLPNTVRDKELWHLIQEIHGDREIRISWTGADVFRCAVDDVFRRHGYEHIPIELVKRSWQERSSGYQQELSVFALLRNRCLDADEKLEEVRRRLGDTVETLRRFNQVCIFVGIPPREQSEYDGGRAMGGRPPPGPW